MGRRKHHHTVSQGHQRLFANGKQILYIDKTTRSGKPVGVRDAFARTDANTMRIDGQALDELEDEWATRENGLLPHVRRVIAGARDESGLNAVKVLAAMSFARGRVFEFAFQRISAEVGSTSQARFEVDEEAQQRFAADFERPAEEGELAELVLKTWSEMQESRVLFIDRMRNAFNFALDKIGPLNVQFVHPSSPRLEFVIGDSPLVVRNPGGRLSNAESTVALGDADRLMLPVSRRLFALFTTTTFGDGGIDDDEVVGLNRMTWDASVRFVGAHPESRVKYMLNRHDLHIER